MSSNSSKTISTCQSMKKKGEKSSKEDALDSSGS